MKTWQTMDSFTTVEMLDEIRRRSVGCMIVVMRVDEQGDTWRYAFKGSPILLGAMSAALGLETRRHLAGPDNGLAALVG